MMRKEKKFPLIRIKIPIFCLTFLSVIFLQLGHPSYVRPTQPLKDRPKLVPAPLLKWPEQGSPYAVLVDKSKQEVSLYHKDNPFKPLKTYPASTGENDGPKSKMNDRKTPEGIYFFTDSFVDRELAPIYGVRAFPLTTPTPSTRPREEAVTAFGFTAWTSP